MLDLVIGEKRNPGADLLLKDLEGAKLEGTLYIGYPVVASSEEPVVVDALLTTVEHGVVAFDLRGSDHGAFDRHQSQARQDDLFAAIHQRLWTFKPLIAGRSLAVDIRVITLAPELDGIIQDGEYLAGPPHALHDLLGACESISPELLQAVNAAIQRVATLKPLRRRTSVKKDSSRGGVMRDIEKEIANLDRWQKTAAIESPEGPQRIRGLAGSGKTVVLALKAAYLHARNPDWRIAVTFHTRSLYQQFRELIRKFSYDQSNEEPDWERLQVLHAWGGADPGVYSEIASRNGMQARTLTYARDKFGREKAFEGVCRELLQQTKGNGLAPLWDAVLIDEAQDLPQPFFELAYLSAGGPKRIVWAYDELQNLSAYQMASPADLFGKHPNGTSRVPDLPNNKGEPRRDVILPICYRNTPWALVTAHALGFGVYREGGLVQFFDDPQLWHDVGYDVVAGALAPTEHVVLERRPDSYPKYFEGLLDRRDVIICRAFDDRESQAKWVAQQIKSNIIEDELNVDDILVVHADPYASKSDSAPLMRELSALDLPAHLAGVTASVDQLFDTESVAISGIYRAKGNEAAMVYIVDADQVVAPFETIKRRNVLFTAITRSRAWVRICGVGSAMETIRSEVEDVLRNEYRLSFTVPTQKQLETMRKIHRDMPSDMRARAKRGTEGLADLLDLIEKGQISAENVPPGMRDQLQRLFGWGVDDDA